MIVKRGPKIRWFATPLIGVVLVMYATATWMVPLADAFIHAEVQGNVEHIDEKAPPCNIGHDELTCPFCQFLGLPNHGGTTGINLSLRPAQAEWNKATEDVTIGAHHWFALGPRGPPPG